MSDMTPTVLVATAAARTGKIIKNGLALKGLRCDVILYLILIITH